MRLISSLIFFVSLPVLGAPFVVTDTLSTGVTQCGVFLDASAKVTIHVTAVTGGSVCKFDIGNVSTGSHTVQMTSITVNDPIWGSLESVKSLPLVFVRPAVPNAPTGLILAP